MKFELSMKVLYGLIIAPIIAFFAPVSSLLMSILWLVIFDIMTGMYVVRITEKRDLTSRGFLKKLPQILMFLVALAAAIHAGPFFNTFGLEKLQAAHLVISFYGLYELFSILENLGKMGLPVAKQLAELLKAKLPENAQKVTETIEKTQLPSSDDPDKK